MKTKFNPLRARLRSDVLGMLCLVSLGPVHGETTLPDEDGPPSEVAEAIPWSQLGTRTGAYFQGVGLAVSPRQGGARLSCAFQGLEGRATPEGLRLTSTTTHGSSPFSSCEESLGEGALNERFRVVAWSVGRAANLAGTSRCDAPAHETADGKLAPPHAVPAAQQRVFPTTELPSTGDVSVDGQTVRFTRPGLVEEYTVSRDGVRQDFVVLEKPAGERPLRVELAVLGAKVEPHTGGAQLVLEKSGRKIAYSRLKVTDATGKELPGRMAVDKTENTNPKSEMGLAVVVEDEQAVYPIRIDPTFSDANWISMGIYPGANDAVYAGVVDGAANLYIGGLFTTAGGSPANSIAF